MNQLMTMTQGQTMTSKELVEVINAIRKEEGNTVEMQHKDMLVKIRNLMPTLGQRSVTPDKYLSSIGQEQPMFLLDKRASLLLVSSESARVNLAIIDRWQELEQQQQQALPQTHIEAVRAYLVTLETVEAQSKQLGIQAEVIQHKRIITNDGTNDFTIARIKELNPDMRFSGQLLNRESDDQELPATKQFGMGKVNTPYSYHREVWEAVYPDAILPD